MDDPRCRCIPTEVDGVTEHQHRCPAGPASYLAIGAWAGLSTPEIEARLGHEKAPPTPASPERGSAAG